MYWKVVRLSAIRRKVVRNDLYQVHRETKEGKVMFVYSISDVVAVVVMGLVIAFVILAIIKEGIALVAQKIKEFMDKIRRKP